MIENDQHQLLNQSVPRAEDPCGLLPAMVGGLPQQGMVAPGMDPCSHSDASGAVSNGAISCARSLSSTSVLPILAANDCEWSWSKVDEVRASSHDRKQSPMHPNINHVLYMQGFSYDLSARGSRRVQDRMFVASKPIWCHDSPAPLRIEGVFCFRLDVTVRLAHLARDTPPLKTAKY